MNKLNDAINVVLMTIGEQILEEDIPITGIYEAELADMIIENVKEELLSEGWSFNTDENWSFTPDINGYVTLPELTLRVDPTDATINYISKEGKLYDKTNQTYKLTQAVKCDVVWNVEFDYLPPIMQQYIVTKAARIVYQRIVGDTNMLQVMLKDEQDALIRVRIYEDDVNDWNIFDDASVSRAITRTGNPTGIRG